MLAARPLLHALLGLCLVPAAAGAQAVAEPASAAFAWERVALDAAGDGITALATDAGRLAVGGERGAWLGAASGPLERVLRRGPVSDVAFAPGGALLVGTADGLYRVAADGRVELRSPEIGAAARAIARIASLPGAVALATGEGAFVSLDGLVWRRLAGALPSGAASVVGLRRTAQALECWTVVRGELWRTRLGRDASVIESRRERLPLASAADAVALRFDVPGADAVLLLPARALVRPEPAASWQSHRLALPPGARARRLLPADGRLWLATDRGLLEASGFAGPWRRAGSSPGGSDVRALARDGGRVFAATDAGLWRGGAGAPRPVAADARTPGPRPETREPSVERLHEVALTYLDLRPARFAALRRGLERRGWLPSMTLRGSQQRDFSWGRDYDEAFVSGDLRRLFDRDRAGGFDWDVTLELEWELGDLAYHPEQVDVSREEREVIELRDDVLDEITQLYFERRRVLAQLAALDGPEAPEAADLRLRAAELAAGIDAWTGGWFSRHLTLFAP